jgi:chaperonin GroES
MEVNDMPLRPLSTKVVVEPSGEEETTAGGILLPDAAKKKPTEGRVVAVGKGRTLDDGKVVPLAVQVGNTVVYSKYGGTEVTLEGKDYVILDEEQIYAIKE